jgi:hypothetical protein
MTLGLGCAHCKGRRALPGLALGLALAVRPAGLAESQLQVAEWARHSVDVLLRIYAKCIDGQHELAKRTISEALRDAHALADDVPETAGTQGDGDAG